MNESIPLVQSAVAMHRAPSGGVQPYPDFAAACSTIWASMHLRTWGDYDQSVTCSLQESMAMNRRLLGEKHPEEIATSLNNIANVLHDKGDSRRGRIGLSAKPRNAPRAARQRAPARRPDT